MRTLKRTTALVVLLGMRAAASASAEEEPELDRVYQMEETVITAAPIIEGSLVSRYAESSAIVTDRQILDLGAQDLPASLRRVPGVTISRYNVVGSYGGGDGGAVFVRGHGSGRPGSELSTMVDGVPRFNGFWTHPLMDLMSLDIAERIEVQKSPRPVLNGNMSFGAVDVQTRRIQTAGTVTRFSAAGGSYGTLIGQISHGGRTGSVDYLLGAGNRRSDGHRDNADGQTEAYYGRLGCRLGEQWDVSVLVDKTRGWANDPLPLGATQGPVTDRYEVDSELYIAALTWKGAANEASVKAYYDDGYTDWRQWLENNQPPEQENGISDYANCGVRGRAVLRGRADTELALGLDADSYGGSFVSNRTTAAGTRIDERLANVAPYALLSRTFGQQTRMTPSVGIRLNHSSEFGTQVGAQAGLVTERGRARLHAGWARAFNLPGIYAAVFYGQYWSRFYEGDEWRTLEPEWLDHLEFGAAHAFGSRLSVEATCFRDKVTDALRVVPPPPPPPSFQNVGEYAVKGVEWAVAAAPVPEWRLFVGGTAASTDPASTPNAPELALSAGSSYTWRQRLRLHVDAEHVGRRYVQGTRSPAAAARVEAYSLANLRAGYLVARHPWVAEVFASLENALDEEYEFRVGYPMPGRTFTAGIHVEL